jgi:hypothetical protein
MRRMALEPRVRHPANVLVGLEPLGQLKGIVCVALAAQTERFDAEEELLRRERAEGGAKVALDFDAGADDVGDCAEGVMEFEAVVAFGRVVHLGEAGGVLDPVEFAAVDDYAADGGAVARDMLEVVCEFVG